MPRIARMLTDREIKKLSATPGEYSVGGARGLLLSVRQNRDGSFSGYWILRRQGAGGFKVSIGAYPALRPELARAKANRLLVEHDGENLAEVLKNQKNQRKSERAPRKKHTLGDVLSEWLDWKEARGEWKNSRDARYKAEQRLMRHVIPLAASLDVATASAEDVARILSPVWIDLPATADILLNLLKSFFTWSSLVSKLRDPNLVNPARWEYLKPLLPSKKLRRREKHFPFLEIDQMPAFFAALHRREGVAARCTEFAILTCSRSANARLARWDQIDFKNRLWTIDEEEMKVSSNGQHIVPLSKQTLSLLREQFKNRHAEDAGLIFPSPRRFKAPLGNTALNTVIKDLHVLEKNAGREGWIDRQQSKKLGKDVIAVQHAISRSTFETWAHSIHAAERPIQLALHHDIDPRLRSAYDRESSIEDKRKLLQQWADFCFQNIR